MELQADRNGMLIGRFLFYFTIHFFYLKLQTFYIIIFLKTCILNFSS
jgi:hypothetical protein